MRNSSAVLEDLVDHLKRHALRTDGPFRLSSGGTSSWYLDGRQTTFDGEGAVMRPNHRISPFHCL